MVFMRLLIIKILRRLESLQWREDVGGQHCPCPALVSFQSGISEKNCPLSVCYSNSIWYLSVRILSISILSAVRIFSVLILSGLFEKRCPLSISPSGQGRHRGVGTFGVLVRRRRLQSDLDMTRPYNLEVIDRYHITDRVQRRPDNL